MRGFRKFLAAVTVAALAPMGASAATLLVNPDGDLSGARGVDVGGTLYDVTFQGGLCADVFGECDSEDDFTVAYADGTAFAQALLDQVFVGVFDTEPERTVGCSTTEACYVGVAGRPVIGIGRATTYAINTFYADADFPFTFALSEDVSSPGTTFASFAQAAAIPLPAAGWGLLAGLGGLAALRRRAGVA